MTNEATRYSSFSKQVFETLSRITKYNNQKKEGVFVNAVSTSRGTIDDPKKVSGLFIEEMNKTQISTSDLSTIKPLPAPFMNDLSIEECKEILSLVSTNKALSYDLLSDLITDKTNADKAPFQIHLKRDHSPRQLDQNLQFETDSSK